MYKVRTYNALSDKGLSRFSADKYVVSEDCAVPDAFMLRSQKLHTEVVPDSLLAVARAGAGVNNIPVTDYTQQGIVVFNTPGANANAVKELIVAGLLLGSRDIYGGMTYVQELGHIDDSAEMGKLLEKEKKRFAGTEIVGKTLGVVGLGAIGSMVARAGMDLGMNVDSRYSGRIFEVASNFLKNAIDAKSSKIDKKLKMVDLQLKKLKLDKEGNKDGSPIEESDGFVISDRNELMKKLLKKG